MKTEVYYFTGTGNSLAVARDISRALNGTLISIPSVMENETIFTNAEAIGIVFPVYCWGHPLIVERFIRKLEGIGDKYIFAIATYGGSPGGVIAGLEKVIKSRDGVLCGGFTVKMPGNYAPMYGAIKREKQQKMFENWFLRINGISRYVKYSGFGKKQNDIPPISWLLTDVLYKNAIKHFPELDKNFHTNNACNGCRLCAEVCPVNNIAFENGRPVWQHQCEQCFACLQWCPREAVQYGKSTENRKRYRNPEIKMGDMMKQKEVYVSS